MQTIDSMMDKIGCGRFQFLYIMILGSAQICATMEFFSMVFMGPIIRCYWKLNAAQQSSFAAGTFVGIALGSVILGKLSDTYGRQPILLLSNIGNMYLTVLCSLSPNIYWLIFTQAAIGFFLGGIESCVFVLMSELITSWHRGAVMVTFQVFTSVGIVITTTLFYLIIPSYGWRVLLRISMMVVFLISIGVAFLPESPRFLLLHNEKEKCLQVINKMAKMNQSKLVSNLESENEAEYSFLDLFHPRYLVTTLLTLFLFAVGGLSMFAIISMTTFIDGIPHRCLQNMSTYSQIQNRHNNMIIDRSCCFDITWEGYKNMYISSTAPVAFVPFTIFIVEIIGRKKTLGIFAFLTSMSVFLLNLCLSFGQRSLLLFFIRGSVASFYTVTVLYATEIFPTSVRSLGLGLGNICLRTGSMLSPFVVNFVISSLTFMGGTMILISLNLIALIASFILPYETKNRMLSQTAHDDNEMYQVKKLLNNYESFNKR